LLVREGQERAIPSTYVILFRGVGGATQLPTKPLREALTRAGFRNVATYINSGNAVLVSDRNAEDTMSEVAGIARKEFGFTKDILCLTREAWSRLIAGNPFPEAVDRPTSLHAFALDKAPTQAAIEALSARTAPHERIVVKGKVLYFHAPEGFGISKLPPVVDRTLQAVSTARNWNTVLKLMELADKAAST
jgi:uncharacterized protein (DUF1697 family)